MDENVSKSPDRGENAENKVAPSAASESPPESQTSDSKRIFGRRSSISARELRTIVHAPMLANG